MLRIVRIRIFDRLPPPLVFIPIPNLKRRRGNQHGQSQALRVHSCLHEFLRRAQIGAAADDGERRGHGSDPGKADDFVAVFFTKGHEALVGGLAGALFGAGFGGGIFELVFGVLGFFVCARVVVGGDDGWGEENAIALAFWHLSYAISSFRRPCEGPL